MQKMRYALYIVIVLSFFLGAITEVPVDQKNTTMVVLEVIKATSEAYSWLAPLIHITTLLLLFLLYTQGAKVGRIFDAYFAALFVFITLSNNIANTHRYGFVVLTGNLVPMAIVSVLWAWEAYRPENDFTVKKLPAWRYWVIPFAVLAFWFPMGQRYGPNFDPLLLLTSDYGVFFCPTTPIALAVLTLFYPRINRVLLSATSLVGLIVGIFNAMTLFIEPSYTIWVFFLHTPLILISFYGLVVPRLVDAGPQFDV